MTILSRAIQLLAADITPNNDLTPGGTAIMVLSVGSVLLLLIYCLYRVLSLPPVEMEETLKGPLEIDTGDTENAD